MYFRLLLKALLIFTCFTSAGCKNVSGPARFKKPDAKTLITQYRDTIEQYETYLAKHSDDSDLRFELGQVYYLFHDYEKARDVLEKLAALKAQMYLAKTLAHLHEYNAAIELFDSLKKSVAEQEKRESEGKLEQPFYDGEYHYLWGRVLEVKNLFPQAIEVYGEIKGEFAEEAQERIKDIKLQEGSGLPSYIASLQNDAQEFLKKVSSEAAIIYQADETIEITEDNKEFSTVHVIEQVLQERGKELAEIDIGYDSTYERVELEFARTISKEGKVLSVGKENIRDVSRYLNFPLYSNARAFIVSMPLVEVGSFIEYKIKIYSSKMMNEDDISFIYRLRERYPIYQAQLFLTVPKKREISFKYFNENNLGKHNLVPKETLQGEKKVYAVSLNEIEPLIPEYTMPPAARINPALLVSSFSSWDELYTWWKSLYSDKMELSDEMKAFTNDLIKGARGDFEKAKAIYEFCAKHIRYVAVEYGQSGHEPHFIHEVFRNRYGDCKDQSILLVGMLRFAGLSAYPVLIPTRGRYPITKDFPSAHFNHAICAVTIGDKLIFMDPTAETTEFGGLPLADQERTVMVFFDDTYGIVEVPRVEKNRTLYKMDIVLDENENATITRTVTTEGFYAAGHRWYLKYTHPSKIKEDVTKKMVEISPFSELQNLSIENVDTFDVSPVLTYTFITEKFLTPAGNLRIIPALDEIRLDHNIIGKKERQFPVDFGARYTNEAIISITLPDNLKINHLPGTYALETDWFNFQYTFERSSQSVVCHQVFTVKQRIVPTERYTEFKKAIEDIFYLLKESVILEKL